MKQTSHAIIVLVVRAVLMSAKSVIKGYWLNIKLNVYKENRWNACISILSIYYYMYYETDNGWTADMDVYFPS